MDASKQKELIKSVEENNIDAFKRLLGNNKRERKANAILKLEKPYDETIYELVAKYHRYEMLRYLLSNRYVGVEVNRKLSYDDRALHFCTAQPWRSNKDY